MTEPHDAAHDPAPEARALLALLDALADSPSARDLGERHVGRVVAGVSLVAVVLAAVLGGLQLALGSVPDAIVSAFAAFGATAAIGVWRATRTPSTTAHVVLAYFLALFAASALVTSAIAYLVWPSVLVLVAFFIGGLRIGLAWSAIVLVTLVGVGAAMTMMPWPDAVPGSPLVRFVRAVSVVPTIAFLGYVFEATRRRSAHELDLARVEADRANAARGRLLAKVSHELRTPLNGVLGLTDALLLDTLPSHVRGELETIRASGQGLLALLNDLLDVARAEAGALAFAAEPFELLALVRGVVALYRAQAEAKALTLTLTLPSEPEVWVVGDAVRVRQVLGNLISNALKFTAEGVVHVRLEAPLDGATRAIVAAVEDTGPGIAPEAQARLFQPFVQLQPTGGPPGTGLGLAISRELADKMGGRLELTSIVGRGSTFALHLALPTTPAREASGAAPPTRLVGARVLVVDDNLVNRRVATALLDRLGAASEAVASGDEALVRAGDARFDVILMDLEMPGLDGLASTRALRARGDATPVVALTASAGPETAAECEAAGMCGCLTKPVAAERLRAALEDALGVRAAPPG
jgi:signal transduction histidine kinase/CheY-like chemotaxis protein